MVKKPWPTDSDTSTESRWVRNMLVSAGDDDENDKSRLRRPCPRAERAARKWKHKVRAYQEM